MGSGTKPRQADKVKIKPQKARGTESGGSAAQEQESLQCPISFSVSLAESQGLVSGMTLALREEGESLAVFLGVQEVGRLNRVVAKKIIACLSSGVRYEGRVREREGDRKKYAEFTQKI